MVFTLSLSLLLIAVAVLLLGVKVFFTPKGQFPNGHVDGNKELRKKGLSCAQSQDLEERNKKNIFGILNSDENIK